MKRKNATRRALFTSMLSLLLCVSMLVGTTFAWFTDEVKSGTNTIAAGNLDVELEYAKVVDGQITGWDKVNENTKNIFDPNALWEPGRVEVAYLKVSNLGTLALKYQLGVNVVNETPGISVKTNEEFNLSDYLVFKVVEMPDAVTTYSDREAVQVAAGTEMGLKDYNGEIKSLDPKDGTNDEDYVALIVYMPETVGNEANYRGEKPVIELGVNLFATQEMYEEDSFGEDYDKNAWHDAMAVSTEEEMNIALANGVEKIKLVDSIVSENGFSITNDVAINLNGHTMTATGERAYLFNVTGDADLTVVGGKLVAESTNGQLDGTGTSTGASSSIRFESTGTLTVEDVEIQGSVRGGHRAIDVYAGDAVLNNVDIISSYGAGVVAGGDGVSAVLNNCDITVNGMYSAPYNSVCFGVWGGAEMTVNSGNYKMINDNTYTTGDTHGGWVGIVMSSGGTLNINGGTYTNVPTGGFNPQYERAILELENNAPAVSTLNLLGGTFIPQEDQVYGGYGDQYYPTYNVPNLIDNGDGTWTALPELEGGGTLSVVSGYPRLYTDGTNYYVSDAQGLISMNNFWKDNWSANNMWGRSYNIMADIDATGYTWNEAYVVVGSNYNDGFVFDGNGHTITGLTINGGLFSGTPNGGKKPEKPGYVQNITFDNVKVVGDHWTGVLWSNVYNELVVKNVSVINSEITGKCNVAALVGGTVIDGAPDASVKFINCTVKNNVITAEGKDGQDPTGANVYISRVYGNSAVTFENCVSEDNTVTNKNGLVGGGIYGYTVWANDGFTGTGICNTFTDWEGLTAVSDVATLKSVNGGNIALAGTVDLGGTQGNYLTLNQDTTIAGGTIKGTGWTGEMNYAVNATEGNIVFDGVTFDTTDWSTAGWANWGISVNVNGTANVTFKNCTFKGAQCPIYQSGADSVITLENCTFDTTSVAIQCEIYSGDFSLGQDLIVKNCDFTGVTDVLHIYDYDKDPSSEAIAQYLTDNGNTFTGVCKQTCN